MTTFVLVHGAWSGAHGFRKVRPLLVEEGHAVFTPSLTGIGERAHLVSPQIGLTTHVQDVVNTILYEDLLDLVLVGFSYGGAVVTASIPHIGDRVRELVYLDAFVPADGQSVWELAGRPAVDETGLGHAWLVPPPPRQFDDEDEAAWQQARRVDHPSRCFTDPVRLSRPLEDWDLGLTYIRATGDAPDAPGAAAFEAAATHAQRSDRWRYHEIATTHMVASNRPEELATILLEIAGEPR